ncbi:hypothetical protein BSKO_03077 [Bryopsis sp. KO-2023]|nr:hypothetical protein BSKO_03077 [Bryopsis sp. KO-2023]
MAKLLCLALTTLSVQGRSLCSIPCMADIYRELCGGASCIITTFESQLASLCSRECRTALSGETLAKCFREQRFMDLGNPHEAQLSVSALVESVCIGGGFPLEEPPVPVFDEEIEGDLEEVASPPPIGPPEVEDFLNEDWDLE